MSTFTGYVIAAGSAVAKGTDVYLFLTGMMLLAELARREGVFDWVAGGAVTAANHSRQRLFLLVYGAGAVITVFLSNDATAVVLTPAVHAAVKKAGIPPLPYLLACAFIANAASFVLPISNPANLVVYGQSLPHLLAWLRLFGLPSLAAIVSTFVALRWFCREDLRGDIGPDPERAPLTDKGRYAIWTLLGTAALLIAASATGHDLGLPTCLAAACAVILVDWRSVRPIAAGVSWIVLPLVALLFVLVEWLNHVGAGAALAAASRDAQPLTASFAVAALSNAMNNLPCGLLVREIPAHLRSAVLIGVDLGPNLSVTGSLATLLWLIALRREGLKISGWSFFKAGAVVMPPALFLATLLLPG